MLHPKEHIYGLGDNTGFLDKRGYAYEMCNVVVPGFMATAMSSTLTDDQRNKIYARTSLKAATSIRSVAETVAFLLSEKAESITGQNIHVDNGTI